MATNFPTSLDSFTNPASTDKVSTVDHAAQHTNINDSVAAVEAKVGINSSAVTTTHDYKLSGVATGDKAVSLTGTETLTNKTLTAPKIATISNTGTITLPTTNATLFGLATTDTLTNKTITDTTNNVAANSLKVTGGATVTVSSAAAPSTGQVLTATSATAADWQTPSTISTSTVIYPMFTYPTTMSSQTISSNTTLNVGRIYIPTNITANNVSFTVSAAGTAGTVKVAMFSDDGATQIFSVTTATISGAGTVTTALSAVSISSGYYYIAVLPVGTAAITAYFYNSFSGTSFNFITGKAVVNGTVTVTASTMPATITPSSITDDHTNGHGLFVRFDN